MKYKTDEQNGKTHKRTIILPCCFQRKIPCGDVVVEQTFGMIFLRATRPLAAQGYTYITNRSA